MPSCIASVRYRFVTQISSLLWLQALRECCGVTCTCWRVVTKSCRAGIGKVTGTAWSFTDIILGCILAASNQLAGKLTDITVARGTGNIGAFGGGAAAAIAATLLLLLFMKFGDLAKPLPVRTSSA